MGSEENKKTGYIQLFRSFTKWEWFHDRNTLQVFLYCILSANHRENKYKGTLIPRGSFVSSYDFIAKECSLTPRQVRTAIKHLKMSGEVSTIFNGKGLIISIKKYNEYQSEVKQVSSKSQAKVKQKSSKCHLTIMNNNDNKDNNVVVVDNDYYNDSFFQEFWDAYGKHGFIDDVYAYWLTLNIDEELKEKIVYGAKRYTKETDWRNMVYPRNFLKNQLWKNYKEEKKEDDREWF